MAALLRVCCTVLFVLGTAACLSAKDASQPDPMAVAPGKPVLRIEPIELQTNLLPNASFEDVNAGVPNQWRWDRRNTDATLSIDESTAHTGRRSVRVTNSTPFGPHVYAMLFLPDGVEVKPDTAYTFSCYVKSDTDINIAWFGGGTQWLHRARFPGNTRGQWARVVLSFKTGPDDRRIPVMLNTESPTAGFWVDDVQLVPGPQPMPVFDTASKGPILDIELPTPSTARTHGAAVVPAWNPTRFPSDQYAFATEKLWAEGLLYLPHPVPRGILTARLGPPAGQPLAETSQTRDFAAGTYLIAAGFWIADVQNPDVQLSLELADQSTDAANRQNAAATIKRRLVTTAVVKAALEQVATLREQLQARIESLRKSGRDPAYPLAALTVLDNFSDYAQQDLAHDEIARAYDAALEMQAIARAAIAREFLPPVPRYATADKRPSFRLDGPAQLGTVRWSDGRVEADWPLQFVGVGAFGQVKNDIEKLPGYGMNIIQVEFGPNSIVVGEDQIDTSITQQYLALLDRAAKAGVAVNLLISPHYFPQWAMQKWPHLGDASGGFLRYDVQAPEARAVLEKFLRTAIPKICHHPALHSICLSNEPLFTDVEKSKYVAAMWHDWLRARHGTIAKLNERWGSTYADFDAIAVPPKHFGTEPIIYDFITFNCETFAQWHAWMASIIRQLAPDVPLHAKIMICAALERAEHGAWCIDPQLFAELSDINGNDAWKFYSPTGPWADSWLAEQMGYDFQRSMADKLVFNSENHLIPDRNFDDVPPAHIHNIFWQGAVHGQSATVTWVWERSYDPTADTAGSILHRPGCAEAMGQSGLDLLRLSREVTALQRAPAQVALVWSPASIVAGQEYLTTLKQTYAGLNFCGVRIGFITERQLAAYAQDGKLPGPLQQLKVILAPNVKRTPETTLGALHKFQEQGGRVVQLGDCFGEDEYGKRRQTKPSLGTPVEAPPTDRAAFDLLRQQIPQWPVSRPVNVTLANGEPAWGVEYLAVEQGGRLLVNLANYGRDPVKTQVLVSGKPVGGTDLRSGRQFDNAIELPSLEPVLLEVRPR